MKTVNKNNGFNKDQAEILRLTQEINLKAMEYNALVNKYEEMKKQGKDNINKKELYSLLVYLRENNSQIKILKSRIKNYDNEQLSSQDEIDKM